MMNEQETVDFANQIASRLAADEDLDTLSVATLARIAEIDGKYFLTWARVLTHHGEKTPNKQAYLDRLLWLNARLVKDPAFTDAVRRLYAAEGPPE